MTRLACIFACLVAPLAAPLAAQDIDCANAAMQMEMNFCAEQEWQTADAGLNAAYQDAMADLKASLADRPEDMANEVTMLRDAQRAWIAFRDANCAVAGYPMRGGSAEPLLIYGCLRDMTEDRTAELNERFAF